MTALRIIRANYAEPDHAQAIVELLDSYACDPMGGGTPLSNETRSTLIAGLAATPSAFSLLAYIDQAPVGLTNCFFGYSTFAAKPLVNIHDMVVLPGHRGFGIARAMFTEIERIAADAGACKITLEVLNGNERAKALYASLGYGDYALDPEKGTALFWQKRLAA
jgi:ribosomal protein S18 acetylase RimI-like enzyme